VDGSCRGEAVVPIQSYIYRKVLGPPMNGSYENRAAERLRGAVIAAPLLKFVKSEREARIAAQRRNSLIAG
jgi:hypothetical protein